MNKLTVALATYNEENNIEDCLRSVKGIASEIVIVDGTSSDNTVELARKYGAKVEITDNPPIFHINKQKALNMASNEWILQLDADERVSAELAGEITKVINLSDEEMGKYQEDLPGRKLFLRHQELLEKRDGKIGRESGPYIAFFIPRLNYFLGKYLRYGGVYPDGVIRLVKKGHAHFPAKDVHEQIAVDGRVGWLKSPLLHIDSKTFSRYLKRNNRYTDLMAQELSKEKVRPLSALDYMLLKPVEWFTMTYFRHKGFLDGAPGFIFSFFSSLRFPISYVKFINKKWSK
jgi:glycosyltransferase involved in cell wall biosynthesis